MNSQRLFINTIFGILLSATGINIPQSGAWNPPGSDLTYPRTLLKNVEVAGVISSLSTNYLIKDLYSYIYSSSQSTIPSGNSTDGDRISRSHIAKNSAFVTLIGKKIVGGQVSDLTSEEKAALIIKVENLLENINTAVASIFSYESWQWRSKELIDYTIAYDLLKGYGVSDADLGPSKTKIQEFAGNLYNHSVNDFFGIFFTSIFNNHTLMTCASLGLAAVVLNDATSTDNNQRPVNWINVAMWNIDNVFFRANDRQSEPGQYAGYAEGPYYLRYAMINCLPFFRSMGYFLPSGAMNYTFNSVTRSIENPFFDANYDYIYQWIRDIRQPNGRMPAIEDTYINYSFPELAQTGKSIYNWPVRYLSNLSGQLTPGNSDSRANYVAANTDTQEITNNLFESFPIAGDLVFRGGWDSTSTYMHVLAKHGIARNSAYGHKQADVSSFLIYSDGEIMALDPGYLSYSKRDSVDHADNHNMILVDGSGPLPGTPSSSNDADGYIENTFKTTSLYYGEVRTNYQNTDITRAFLFIRSTYFIDGDFLSAAALHNYQWQLHGYGLEGGDPNNTGAFYDNLVNDEGRWEKNGVNLLVHSIADDGATYYTKTTAKHELSYNTSGYHTVMQVNKNTVQNAEFLSVLYPYSSNAPAISTISSSPALINISNGTYYDLAFIQNGIGSQTFLAEATGLVSDLTSDSELFLFTTTDNASKDFIQLFVKNGTGVTYGSREYVNSDTRMDIAFQKIDPLNYEGYVSSAGTVIFDIYGSSLSVIGNNVASFQNLSGGRVSVLFEGASNFSINVDNLVPVELLGFFCNREGLTVLLKWTTATEVNNYGFEIERSQINQKSENCDLQFEKIGFVEGYGNSNSPKDYSFRDNKTRHARYAYRLKQIDTDGSFEYSNIVESDACELPEEFVLEQNYPNPFNPLTKINCQIPGLSFVTLKIYDVLGSEIATLINEEKPIGTYEVEFDASKLPSGVYFYRLQAGDPSSGSGRIFIQTKKMVLMK